MSLVKLKRRLLCGNNYHSWNAMHQYWISTPQGRVNVFGQHCKTCGAWNDWYRK